MVATSAVRGCSCSTRLDLLRIDLEDAGNTVSLENWIHEEKHKDRIRRNEADRSGSLGSFGHGRVLAGYT